MGNVIQMPLGTAFTQSLDQIEKWIDWGYLS